MSSVRGAALALLGRRDYTAAELRERLIEKGHDAGEVDEQIELLTAGGAINDARVAATHIRVASQVKGRGRMRIRQELMARGVAKPVIESLLAEMPPDDEAAAIQRFLSRRRIPESLTPIARNKVFQQLLRKGFTADAISKALRHRE
ncbi:MAG: regulatory protein RecX [Acidobacteria bacterium]|nr:MAG: regulatory protein RecX [Acidobacteriota bacterium]